VEGRKGALKASIGVPMAAAVAPIIFNEMPIKISKKFDCFRVDYFRL